MKSTGDIDLINSDEILRSLMHRAAYRAHIALHWVVLPLSIVLIFIVQDAPWDIVGYTLFAVFFLSSLFFEVNQAYDGVFRGLDELRRSVSIDRSVVVRRAAWSTIKFIGLFVILGRFMNSEESIFHDLFQGSIVGLIYSSIELFRWRHIFEKKSR